jgi:dipeptidyl aminopeptidase/acylaminoacyl peptidase
MSVYVVPHNVIHQNFKPPIFHLQNSANDEIAARNNLEELKMRRRTLLSFLYAITLLFAAACVPLIPSAPPTETPQAPEDTPTAFVPVPTETLVPEITPTTAATEVPATPTQGSASGPGGQFLAYISNGQLLVTDVTNNVKGGTTQYTVAGESDQVTDLVWSPSGEFVAFVAAPKGDQHLFYIYALGASTPTDLGPGSAPAWSPDSHSLVYVGGTYPDNNIWTTTIDNPAPHQLTSETNYAWGRPAFTPDGQSLVVAGADRNNMGAQGNTNFTLEYLELDGSGTRTPLPNAAPMDGVRLPYDLRFSPNGTSLAFSTSSHISACAAPGAYYVIDQNSTAPQELVSPSLKGSIDPSNERYNSGLSFDWTSTGDGLVALGQVFDCAANSPTSGQIVAGPQMSILGLDGSERTIIPGFFYGMSVDRTGNLIAAAHFQGGFQDLNPNVEIYSAQTGQLLLPVGPGSNPEFQP